MLGFEENVGFEENIASRRKRKEGQMLTFRKDKILC